MVIYSFIDAGDTTQFLLHVTGQVSREGLVDIVGVRVHSSSENYLWNRK